MCLCLTGEMQWNLLNLLLDIKTKGKNNKIVTSNLVWKQEHRMQFQRSSVKGNVYQ